MRALFETVADAYLINLTRCWLQKRHFNGKELAVVLKTPNFCLLFSAKYVQLRLIFFPEPKPSFIKKDYILNAIKLHSYFIV